MVIGELGRDQEHRAQVGALVHQKEVPREYLLPINLRERQIVQQQKPLGLQPLRPVVLGSYLVVQLIQALEYRSLSQISPGEYLVVHLVLAPTHRLLPPIPLLSHRIIERQQIQAA